MCIWKRPFDHTELTSKLIAFSDLAIHDQQVANTINIAALQGMVADKATGQDTRANIVAFDFAVVNQFKGTTKRLINIQP